MEIKRGSVTPVDLTGQADGDYIRNDGGVYKPRTAGQVIRDLLYQDLWQQVEINDLFFTHSAFTNTGRYRGDAGWRWRAVETSTTANSTARLSIRNAAALSFGQTYTLIDWRKVVAISFRVQVLSPTASTANSQKWIYWGDKHDDAVQDPTRKGIGIRCDQNAIFGITHNGTTLTSVATGQVLNGAILVDVFILSDGVGNVDWYINGVLRASSANGPAALGTAEENCIRMYLTNGADASNNVWSCHAMNIYVEQ